MEVGEKSLTDIHRSRQRSKLLCTNQHFSCSSRWVWLIVAFNHFWAHTLDGLDGKHARRTNTSSPLGELFDHGLDSWVTTLHALCIFSVFGRDHEFGVPTYRLYYVLWTLLILFSLSHWEKYNTGILYLPWGYDLSEVTGLLVYITTAIFGHGFWRSVIS